MIYDLQKAMIWKRISAWLFDSILLGILVVGLSWCLSQALGYDGYQQMLDERYDFYENQYGVSLNIGQAEYEDLLPDQQQAFRKASEAISRDPQAGKAYTMMINLSLVIASISILGGFLLLEFAVPLAFSNGQTLGKKIFSIGVMSTDGLRVSTFQMFARTVLGKFTLETMIPVMTGILIFFGSLGFQGTMIILGLGVLQILLLAFTRTNSLIHDLLAKTVVIDMPSQMIFESAEEMQAYKKKVREDLASRQEY